MRLPKQLQPYFQLPTLILLFSEHAGKIIAASNNLLTVVNSFSLQQQPHKSTRRDVMSGYRAKGLLYRGFGERHYEQKQASALNKLLSDHIKPFIRKKNSRHIILLIPRSIYRQVYNALPKQFRAQIHLTIFGNFLLAHYSRICELIKQQYDENKEIIRALPWSAKHDQMEEVQKLLNKAQPI